MMLLKEGVTVSWDPAPCCYCDNGFWIPDGTGWVLFFSFAIYLCWLPLQWMVRWRATRYLLPALMLAVAVAAPSMPFNVPGVIGAGLAALALEDAAVPAWAFTALAAVLSWIGWYAAVLCIELRDVPVRLQLTSR
jgi:hypothetical protein